MLKVYLRLHLNKISFTSGNPTFLGIFLLSSLEIFQGCNLMSETKLVSGYSEKDTSFLTSFARFSHSYF